MTTNTKARQAISSALTVISLMLRRKDHGPILKPQRAAFDVFEYLIANVEGQGYIVTVQFAPTIKGIPSMPEPPERKTLRFLNLPFVTFYAFESEGSSRNLVLYGPREFLEKLGHKRGIPDESIEILALEDIQKS